jgi:hypothetical protein
MTGAAGGEGCKANSAGNVRVILPGLTPGGPPVPGTSWTISSDIHGPRPCDFRLTRRSREA